jgi:hypothetical protein
LLKAESRRADGTAAAAPKSIPGQNTFRITQRYRPAQAGSSSPQRRRRIIREMWGTSRAVQAHELQSLPPGSPRVRPTLAKLRLREPA